MSRDTILIKLLEKYGALVLMIQYIELAVQKRELPGRLQYWWLEGGYGS